jgi:hypothetical protein
MGSIDAFVFHAWFIKLCCHASNNKHICTLVDGVVNITLFNIFTETQINNGKKTSIYVND